MTLPMGKQLAAQAGAKQSDIELTWQGSMEFDGTEAHFQRNVIGRTNRQRLDTDRLTARLTAPIDFMNPPAPGQKTSQPELEQLMCVGGVVLESRSVDEKGELSSIDRMGVPDLAINRATGAINAHGPGWLSSVRLASASEFQFAPPGLRSANNDPPKDPTKKGMNYVGVKFAREMVGNIDKREAVFSDRVKAVYGPVKNWNQTLDPDNSDQIQPGGATLSSDQLTLRQMPATQNKYATELETMGNTWIEGQMQDGSTVTARAHRTAFSEQKSLLVLEGDGLGDAQFYRQTRPGVAPEKTLARRILYWTSTGQTKIEEQRMIDLGHVFVGTTTPVPAAPVNVPNKPRNPPQRSKPLPRAGAAATGS
jgi:hypothetical protein